MKIVLVYNAKAGGKYTATSLRALFDKHNNIIIEKLIPINDTFASSLAPFIKKKATIAAVGGDGTLSAVAGLLAGTEATFVPLPGGTLNHFTKDLCIDQDIEAAIGHLLDASVRSIDVAEVNGTTFINNSSIGLYSSSLRTRDKFERYTGKWIAAIIASVRALVRFRTYIVTIDNETFYTPFVFVGNNTYRIGADGVTRKSLDKGVLSVFIARTRSRLVLFKIVLFALAGKIHLLDEFDERKTTKLSIKSKRKRLNVSRDGEVARMNPPLVYTARPASLRILY